MYRLRSTIKCPVNKKDQILGELEKLQILNPEIEEVEYDRFINESRLYYDFVFPEMVSDRESVVYISYEFEDTPEGRKACHRAEWSIGWIPQNIRYVKEGL